ncbi:MAG: coproporphyrinogen-III oxidase family protein [Cyanobium sp.]
MTDPPPVARPRLPPIAPRSAYLHIPFCHRRCFYCDFAVVPLGDRADGADGPGAASIAAYLEQLSREIRLAPAGPPLATVYLGGGTPSMLTPAQVGALLTLLRQRYGLMPGGEITLEMDPASFDQARLEGYLQVGINRVSLGGQSFSDAVLEGLGRRHRADALRQAAGWLQQALGRGGLTSWSLDLLQALPGQDLPQWDAQLQEAIALAPPHLSIYDLIVEPGTVFAWRQQRGELHLPDEDTGAELMWHTQRRLSRAGYGHYEVSNYALPGHACRHNRVYWSGAGWWGFGMGATAAPDGVRRARPRTREAYAAWLEQLEARGGSPQDDGEPMAWEDRWLVGLRRREGVNAAALLAEAGLPSEALADLQTQLAPFVARGVLRLEGPRWRLSDPEGLALSNAVLRELLRWWEHRGPADR